MSNRLRLFQVLKIHDFARDNAESVDRLILGVDGVRALGARYNCPVLGFKVRYDMSKDLLVPRIDFYCNEWKLHTKRAMFTEDARDEYDGDFATIEGDLELASEQLIMALIMAS